MKSNLLFILTIILFISALSQAQEVNDTCSGAIDYVIAFGPISLPENGPPEEDGLDLSTFTNTGNHTYCTDPGDVSAWYSWTATFDAINFTPGQGNPRLSVYKGSCGVLEAHGCANEIGTSTIDNFEIDSVYYFNIWGDAPGGPVTWQMSKASTLFEDVCGCALFMSCNQQFVRSMGMATDVDAEPVCQGPPGTGGVTMGPGIWINFMGTGDTITISTDNPGTDFNTELILYEGQCLFLNCIGGDDDGGSGTTSTITFKSDTFTSYYIYVKGHMGDTGTYDITLTCKAPPNDDCLSDSTLVMGALGDCPGNVIYGSTFGADSGQVVCFPVSAPALWYSFTTLPGQTSVNMQLEDLHPDGLHGFEILDSCGGTSFACGNPEQNVIGGLTPLTEYVIGVFGIQQGPFSLCLQVPGPPPINDLCADALTLTCGMYYSDSTTWATDADEFLSCNGPPGDGTSADPEHGVWFKFTGTGDTMTVSTDFPGPSFDNSMDLYRGNCDSLECIGSDGGSGSNLTSKITFLSEYNASYYVYLDGWQEEKGHYTIGLICVCPDSFNLFGSPFNKDDFETSGTITSVQRILAGDTIDYDASLEIDLSFEFEVELGAVFNAIIDSCDSGGGGSNLGVGSTSTSQVVNLLEVSDQLLEKLVLIKKYEPEFYQQIQSYFLPEEAKIRKSVDENIYQKIINYRPPIPWR